MFFCVRKHRPHSACPARNAMCLSCGKKGHFQSVCRSLAALLPRNSVSHAMLSAATPGNLSKATVCVTLCDHELQALVDTGSSESFISESCVRDLGLSVLPASGKVSMAATSLSSHIHGCHMETLEVQDCVCSDVRFLGCLTCSLTSSWATTLSSSTRTSL